MRKLFFVPMIAGAFIALGLYFSFAPVGSKAGENTPKVGQPAPDFSLPVSADKKIHLADFKGRWLILYFYPKDMTPGCTIEARRFQKDIDQFKALNAAIVGVSADEIGSHNLFSKQEGLTFPLASDVGGKTARAYDSWYGVSDYGAAMRNTYLIDPQGQIAKVFTGVDPEGHSSAVLATIRQLQSTANR